MKVLGVYGKIKYYLINFLKRMKIRNKFMVSFIIIILIISFFVLTSVITISKNIFEDYTLELANELVKQIANNVDYRTEEIEESTYSVIQNERLKTYLNNSVDGHEEEGETITNLNIRSTLNGLMLANEYVNSVIIKTNKGNYHGWEKDELGKKNEELSHRLMEDYITAVKNVGMPSDNGVLWLKSPYSSREVILARPIIDENNVHSQLGIALFNINSDFLMNLRNGNHIVDKESIAIVGHNNQIFVENNIVNEDFFKALNNNDTYKEIGSSNYSIEYLGEKYILVESRINDNGWKVLSLISKKYFLQGINQLSFIIVIIILVCIVIAIIIAFVISNNISKNISMLEVNIRKVEEGDFNIRIKPSTYDEIGLIGLRFNYMANKINELISTLSDVKAAKQKAEFDVLIAQINPHFLYNTLGSIKWLARMKEDDEIESMVNSLIELLKTAIKKKGTYQTIQAEIEYVKYYIQLQKACFDGEFNVIYKIDDSVKDFYVLNFILQPIIENALYHGIDLLDDHAFIMIKAYKEKSNIIIKVIDNGIGMSEDKTSQILCDEYKKEYTGFSSIGVNNVNQRIKMYYGEEYGLAFKSGLDKGTEVTYKLPCVRTPRGE